MYYFWDIIYSLIIQRQAGNRTIRELTTPTTVNSLVSQIVYALLCSGLKSGLTKLARREPNASQITFLVH